MKLHSTEFYPPLYFERLQHFQRRLWAWNLAVGVTTCNAVLGYLQNWRAPFFELAPGICACSAFYFIAAWFSWKDVKVVRILPYFAKGDERVTATTFVSGHALSQHFGVLETLATRQGCEPLSNFGFADDFEDEIVVWHDARRGLKTVDTLLEWCKEEIDSLVGVERDLQHLKSALEDAVRKSVPFCLLLRHGDSWSGAELDIRKGHFGDWPD